MFKYILLFVLLNLCFVSAVEFSISSSPSNAKVWIDGVYTHHYTPTDEVEQSDVIELWSEGKHILKLTKSGYFLEQEITLVEGERLNLDLVIPELNGDSETNGNESNGADDCKDCPECEKCEKCDDCPECEKTIEYVEKIVYVENNSCDIEKVIKPITGNIVYDTDDKEQKLGVYFLCFVLILLVVGLYVKKRYNHKGDNRDSWQS